MIRTMVSDLDAPIGDPIECSFSEFARVNRESPDVIEAVRLAWRSREHHYGRRVASVVLGGGAQPRTLVTLHRYDDVGPTPCPCRDTTPPVVPCPNCSTQTVRA